MQDQDLNHNRYEQQKRKKAATKGEQKRSQAGYSRTLKVPRTNNASHPGRGGSHGYPLWIRIIIVNHAVVHGAQEATEIFNVSLRSIQRWRQRITPYRQTGGKRRVCMTGTDLMLLTICLFFYPRATADEIAAFIVSNGGDIYSRQTIYKRCKELKLGMKRGSLEAYQAFTPANQLRAEMFWNDNLPLGVADVSRWRLIDIDEAHFTLKAIERKYGRAKKCVRVRDVGHYARGQQAWNLLIAVEAGNPAIPHNNNGSRRFPRRWFRITKSTVDQHVFSSFVDQICRDIEERPLAGDGERVLMWDNLSCHMTPIVQNTVYARPTRDQFEFELVPRPPYQPKWAPVEYFICMVANSLSRKVQPHWDDNILRHEIHNSCMGVGMEGGLDRTFEHCGYHL